MKKIIGLLLILTIVGGNLMLGSIAGVVIDNDGSSYITKAEFEAQKTRLDTETAKLMQDLNVLVDTQIQVCMSSIPSSGDDKQEVLDRLFPRGCVILASSKPSFGTWEEITDASGCALWIDSGGSWGQRIAQGLPLPKWEVKEYEDNPSWESEELVTGSAGAHSHTITLGNASTTRGYGNKETKLEGSYATSWTATHEPHTHTITAEAKVSEVAGHTHEVINESKFNGEPNSKVQPYAYVVKMWKRTA